MSSEITLANFRAEIELLKQLKDKKEECENIADEAAAKFNEQKEKVLSYMQEHELPSMKVPGVANIVIANKFYCAYPQSQEDIQKFHEYLDTIGRGHERKLHSQTLNTLVNQMVEEAKDKGEVYTPPPGLGLPTTKAELRVLKG